MLKNSNNLYIIIKEQKNSKKIKKIPTTYIKSLNIRKVKKNSTIYIQSLKNIKLKRFQQSIYNQERIKRFKNNF